MKDRIEKFLANYIDYYGDAYITVQNIRYSLKENIKLLFDHIEKGDFIFESDNGFILITGFSDNAKRKYIKIITQDLSTANELLEQSKTIPEDLYIKLNKLNPLVEICKKCGFEFFGDRGKEILLVRKYKE